MAKVTLLTHYWEALQQIQFVFISLWHSDQVFWGYHFLSLIGGQGYSTSVRIVTVFKHQKPSTSSKDVLYFIIKQIF